LYRARKLKLKSAPIETKVIPPTLLCQYESVFLFERRKGSAAPGRAFFGFFLCTSKERNPPAVLGTASKHAGEARSTKLKAAHQAAFNFIRRVTAKNA
jgi:hypothetical protein